MGDFIKELTIIDFLGMIVPGSLLVLLFTKDYEVQSIWSDYFGNDTVASAIILLIAGYLFGMLIHELGDILEKQIWKMNSLNPRYYAAKEVFLNVEKKYQNFDSTEWKTFKEKCERESEDEKAKTEEKKKEKIQMLLSVISLGLLYIVLFLLPVFQTLLTKKENIGIYLFFAFAIVAIGAIVVIYLVSSKKGGDAKVVGYLKQNAAIQTETFGKATAAKRQIFDGFYCVMRNFLMVIGITNVYSIIMVALDRDSDLLCKVNAFYWDWVQIIIYSIVVVGMLHRCWHYACLKYKYTYEDYLYILEQKEKQPSSKNRAIISMSNRE